MGSKGRLPPPHLRHPLSSPGMMYPDPFNSPPVRPSPGGLSHFDGLPPPEFMEHKLAGQHMEIQKLVTENQRLASTHSTLRQELAAAQNELQLLHGHIGSLKSEREQQTRSLVDKIGKMETDLKAAESLKKDIQQARAEAQSLVTARQELIAKVQQLNQDLGKAGSQIQQMPRLFSELEALRQEYQHCRATYDYEKKLYNDHVEHLQAMEKNYMTMATEVEKLREKLANGTNFDRTGSTYGAAAGFNENNATGSYPGGQNAYAEGYAPAQVATPLPGGLSAGGSAPNAVPNRGAPSGAGVTPQTANQPGPASASYSNGPGPVAKVGSGPAYDAQRGPIAPNYGAHGAAIAPSQVPAYNAQRPFAPGYEMQMAHGYYDMHRGPGYDAPRGTPGFQGQVPPSNNVPYGATPQQIRPGTGHEVPSWGGNTTTR
ncbi:hypothetical protein LIER_36277 [Lithospermum erythrorhizon]|uniref:Protein FLX-like 2 n=1 Tax=Lithospermum erythrorhizon TaxID=34254 RepID=A0AAV3P436_LITER